MAIRTRKAGHDKPPLQAAANDRAAGWRFGAEGVEDLNYPQAHSPRLAAQGAVVEAIAQSPRPALQRQIVQRLGLELQALQPPAVVQRWPVPSLSNLVLLGGGLAATVGAPAWTSLLAMGGGAAMVLAVVREGAQAFGQTQEPRDEDVDAPDETLDEHIRLSETQLQEASRVLSTALDPAQREQGEEQATKSLLELADAEAVKASKKKRKRKKKKTAKAVAEEMGEQDVTLVNSPEQTAEDLREAPQEHPREDEQASTSSSTTGEDQGGGWVSATTKKIRGPRKTMLEKVQSGFEQALCLTADRDPPAMDRNNGGEVQGFRGLEPDSAEWRWLKNNVEGRVYENHGMALSSRQSLRWYVTASSNSGASFDVSLHLYDGDTDSRRTCLVLHVAK
jgi:hypothetical protein